jgi:hypothetical protein
MKVRDDLSTQEKYLEIIERQDGYITEWLDKIKLLEESERKNIQLYNFSNQEVIQNVWNDILRYQYDNFLAKYSVGMSMNELRKEINPIVSSMEKSWKKSDGYVQMVWMLAVTIMLEAGNNMFAKLVKLVEKDNPKDYLIDFLIHSCSLSWKTDSDKLKFNRPYQATQEIISLARISKEKALDRLKKYLTKEWYRGHSDTGWHDAHKSKWNIHTGYWSFESGALVKILELDDASLKGLPYYPYDMVHWADEKTASGHSDD